MFASLCLYFSALFLSLLVCLHYAVSAHGPSGCDCSIKKKITVTLILTFDPRKTITWTHSFTAVWKSSFCYIALKNALLPFFTWSRRLQAISSTRSMLILRLLKTHFCYFSEKRRSALYSQLRIQNVDVGSVLDLRPNFNHDVCYYHRGDINGKCLLSIRVIVWGKTLHRSHAFHTSGHSDNLRFNCHVPTPTDWKNKTDYMYTISCIGAFVNELPRWDRFFCLSLFRYCHYQHLFVPLWSDLFFIVPLELTLLASPSWTTSALWTNPLTAI